MNRYLLVICLLLSTLSKRSFGQDTAYIRQMVNELASPEMLGRGYVEKGDLKAATFIASELKAMVIEPLGKNYFQTFSFPMNTFPSTMEVSIEGKRLEPVMDYVISPNCPTVKGTYELVYLPQKAENDSLLRDSLSRFDYSGKVLVLNFKRLSLTAFAAFNCEGFVLTKQRSLWWASTGKSVAKKPVVLLMDSLIQKPHSITIDIKNKFHKKYKSQNVLAKIEGSEQPDSFIVFSAHYDHLGLMGQGNIFRGANDNASGTAAILALAKYFSQPDNKPKYSIAFLFFAAEECGLLGSKHYAENPAVALSSIKALINLDMVGSGSKGIAAINGEDNPSIVNRIKEINTNQHYFDTIKVRPNSCNSDHCPMAEKGVPALFIYTMGDEFKEYHNLNDNPEDLPLTKMWELQQLLINYCKQPN